MVGKKNGVWLKKPGGVKYFFYHRLICCRGAQTLMSERQKKLCVAVTNTTKPFIKSKTLIFWNRWVIFEKHWNTLQPLELYFRTVRIERNKALILLTCFVRDGGPYAILQEKQSLWEESYSFGETWVYLKVAIKSFFICSVHSECV